MPKGKTPQRIVYAAVLKKLSAFTEGERKRVLLKNPGVGKTSRPVIYVGETGLTAEERYQKHLDGIKSPRGWIRKYGVRLLNLSTGLTDLPGITEATRRQIYHLSRPLRTDSKVREAEVAKLLRESGYYVVSA